MPDRKIKRQRHPAKSFLKSPLSLYFLAPSWLSGYKSIMQNKANFKMGKIAISKAPIKAYVDKQRTMSNERYQKQTQSNPIPPSLMTSPNRITATRPMESCQKTYAKPSILPVSTDHFRNPCSWPKTENRAVLRGFMGRPQDMGEKNGTFFGSFAAGSIFPIL